MARGKKPVLVSASDGVRLWLELSTGRSHAGYHHGEWRIQLEQVLALAACKAEKWDAFALAWIEEAGLKATCK